MKVTITRPGSGRFDLGVAYLLQLKLATATQKKQKDKQQGVATHVSPEEAFTTKIKMESSNPLRANQGIKVNSEQQKSTDQRAAANQKL